MKINFHELHCFKVNLENEMEIDFSVFRENGRVIAPAKLYNIFLGIYI